MEMEKCSVIILNWNGAEMLRRYLPSVIKSIRQETVELIVADNGSTDNSLEVMAKEFPAVKTIVLDKNYGFAEGYNRAIEQVDSEYVVLLNSDVETPEGWLSPCNRKCAVTATARILSTRVPPEDTSTA